MTSLKEVKADLAGFLSAAGLNAKPTVPERVTPPVAVVQAGSIYVQRGGTFTTDLVSLEVVLVAGKATNATSENKLDDMINTTITALKDVDELEAYEVQQPFELQTSGASFLAVIVTVQLGVTL